MNKTNEAAAQMTARPARRTRRQKLMGLEELDGSWRDGRCDHAYSLAVLAGNCASRRCAYCDVSVDLWMEFGRPKTFSVFVRDGGYPPRRVGRTSVRAASGFTVEAASDVDFEDGAELTDRPKLIRNLTGILVDTLYGDDDTDPERPSDFESAWRGSRCRHASAIGSIEYDTVDITCKDCHAWINFTHAGDGGFDVSVADVFGNETEYGRHGTDAVARAVREYCDVMFLPRQLADCMSDDPERDARRTVGLVHALERGGLLRRAEIGGRNAESVRMIEALSAAVCSRQEFVPAAKAAVADLRARNIRFEDDGEPVTMRRAVEGFRLAWPYWFAGNGVDVVDYDPTGEAQFCVRCMHSTLDDDDADAGYWKDGCPKCGYGGYLLDMDDAVSWPAWRWNAL